mmetsp:Transcript_3901/g.10209  ORF Transcript_3901/g.10209 Transcript_3901/m.10209 type:complete len:922 (+) Transcript_3901:109-2874(+)
MDYIGSDFSRTGSVIPKSELTAARLKRGECVTCGRKCYKKKLFKMVPIDNEEGKIVNGRCLHCNPLQNKCNNRSNKESSNHSYNSTGSTNFQQSKGNRADDLSLSSVVTAECELTNAPHVVDLRVTKQRRNSLSGSFPSSPFPSTLSTHPTSQQNNQHPKNPLKIDTNYGNKLRSNEDSSAPTLHSKSQQPPSNPSLISNESLQYQLFNDDSNYKLHAHLSHRPNERGSFHSMASSSGPLDSGSTSSVTATSQCIQHTRRPSSPQNSMNSNSMGSLSNLSSQIEPISNEQLKRAVITLMKAAEQHGLAEAGDTLAATLKDIVDSTNTGISRDDLNISIPSTKSEDNHRRTIQKESFLDRGGLALERCGRLIYTGSTRTLSSMSSVDEGDRSFIQSAHLQQSLRGMGKSSQTLGSLSIIDGTNEEAITSLATEHSKSKISFENGAHSVHERDHSEYLSRSGLILSSNKTKKTQRLSVSLDMVGKHRIVQKIRSENFEETSDHDTEIEIHLQRLKDYACSSVSICAIEVTESLSKLVTLCFGNHGPQLDIYIERGLVEVLVTVMRKYAESSGIQAKACDLLAILGGCNGGHPSPYTRLRRLKIIAYQEQAGEAILFSSMILHETNPAVQEAALKALRYLCKDCDENQTGFWNLDAIGPVLRALVHHSNEARVQEAGAAVVSMLASNPNNENAKSIIGLNGGILVFIRAISIHLKNVRVVETCIHALYTLVLDHTQNIMVVLHTLGAIGAILSAMVSHNQSLAIQEVGCNILAKLTAEVEHLDLFFENDKPIANDDDNENDKTNKLLESVIETIHDAIQTHSNSSVVQKFGFAALANLIDSNGTKIFVVDMGVLDAIVLAMFLHKDNAEIQQQICDLLLLLAVQENHQHILATNPIGLLKKAAHKFPEECMEPVSQLIYQLRPE